MQCTEVSGKALLKEEAARHRFVRRLELTHWLIDESDGPAFVHHERGPWQPFEERGEYCLYIGEGIHGFPSARKHIGIADQKIGAQVSLEA